ncbi:MAG: DUF29 domain-containing protein [Cyanosarcina radialis HA8281-LM2]|jgi:hypothetical protein|nr:DUF29 domain-containing protein [Cyanosarcina radialis HA8281-LM2]
MSKASLTTETLYDRDYCAWLERTAALLRAGKLHELDIENLTEEIEDLGKSQQQALKSNLIILLLHLLKYKYQPQKQESLNSWISSILEHRRRIELAIEDSPSLKNYYREVFDLCYAKARRDAATETKLPLVTFPEVSPFTPEAVLQADFLPSAEPETTDVET